MNDDGAGFGVLHSLINSLDYHVWKFCFRESDGEKGICFGTLNDLKIVNLM